MTTRPDLMVAELHQRHSIGEVGGVHFNFSHKDLNESWRPAQKFGGEDPPWGPRSGGIRVLFPWANTERHPQWARCAPEDGDGQWQAFGEVGCDVWFGPGYSLYDQRLKLSGWSMKRHIIKYGPDCILKPKDQVVVRSVRRHQTPGLFLAPAEQEFLRVYYSVIRADGSFEKIRRNDIYLSADVFNPTDLMDNIRGWTRNIDIGLVNRRLSAVMQKNWIRDGRPTSECEGNASRCHTNLWLAGRMLKDFPANKLVQQSLLEAGYYLAKAEAAANMAPLAKKAVGSLEGSSRGGAISSARKEKIKLQKWGGEAKNLCLRLRDREPSIS